MKWTALLVLVAFVWSATAQEVIEFRGGSTKVVAPSGDEKKAVVRIWPEPGLVQIYFRDGDELYKEFTREQFADNPDTSAVTYAHSKNFRTKTVIGTAILCPVCGLGVAFMKSKKHWITIQSGSDLAAIRASKKNYIRLRGQAAAALGVLPTITEGK